MGDRLRSFGFFECPFPDEVWAAYKHMSALDSRMSIQGDRACAKLMWAGVPYQFISAWTTQDISDRFFLCSQQC